MALADSKKAIGAVSELLKTQLTAKTSANTVDIGRPEEAAGSSGPKLNLFLYQVEFDGHLKNYPLDQGQVPPLWVVLHYLLTAFDQSKESDSKDAHELLGEGLLALQELNFLRPNNPALTGNPEPLKITFDLANAELLSKLMQGTDEKYRVSVAFRVRPVMLVTMDKPSYGPPIKTVGPPGNEGVLVLPSMGPQLDEIKPFRFEVNQEITLYGRDLGSDVIEVCFGNVCESVTSATQTEVKVTIPLSTSLSAGSYPVTAVRTLPNGRRFSSNALLGHLMPTLSSASIHGNLTNIGGKLFGKLQLQGRRLGGPSDSIFVAFYKDGRVELMLEAAGTAAQTSKVVTVTQENALPPGKYIVILRVNGQQAANAPEVSWS